MMSLDEYIATYPDPQAGPCIGCGETNYSLSMGGPGICPACDCVPAERRVKQLAEENRRLRAMLAQLQMQTGHRQVTP